MKTIIKTFFSLLFIYCFCGINAQTFYTLKTSSATYENITSIVQISDTTKATIDETYRGKIPFRFKIFDKELDFSYGNGITVFRDAYIVDYNLYGFVIEPCYALLKRKDASSSISYSITGTFPNRILKFQWKNMGLQNQNSSDFLNVQLWLHEEDNRISVHFGPNSVTATGAFVGGNKQGPEIGVLRYNPNTQSFTRNEELVGNPANPTLITAVNQALNGMPTEGTVYTFYPSSASTSTRFASNISNSVSIYPNPATNSVSITTAHSNTPLYVEMFDNTGRKIDIEYVRQNNTLVFDTRLLANGIYQCIISQNNSSTVSKLIIAK